MQTAPFDAGSILSWRELQDATVHRAELTHLVRSGERAWVSLPSALLETRYQLSAVEQSFSEVESATVIQAKLHQAHIQNSTEFAQHHLIAQPQAGCPLL